ncbi:MAG: Hsp33 family molecular chaperone HslO [Oscillospiraceae bacterium]|nr:Hsp33 family molecular chaperone HslO [Oscillospiraceae bacterium]
MSNSIHRAISQDGSVVASAINATNLVNQIEKFHHPSAVVTAALGRLAIAASLMGYGQKNEEDRLTIRIDGDGAIGSMIAVADSHGNVKCCADQYIVEIPLNSKNKLDVGGAVGTGTLSVIKDLGLKEPYVGTIPLVSGEIAEDLANYYATSEQIPTVLSLGVLVAPDLTVQHAGGFLIQLLPFADEACIPVLEQNLANMPSFTQMLSDGMTADEIALRCLDGLTPNLLDSAQANYVCDCSRERTSKILISIGREELQNLADTQETIEVCCHFCDKKYQFTPKEILSLIDPDSN